MFFPKAIFQLLRLTFILKLLDFFFFFFVRDSIGKPTGKFNIKT